MRRFLIITLSLGGLGLVIWLLRRSDLPESDLSASAGSRLQPPSRGADELSKPASGPVSQPEPVDGCEQLMAELVEIRARVVEERLVTEPTAERVSQPDRKLGYQSSAGRYNDALDIAGDKRRAVDGPPRGVPYFQLFFMDRQGLFEAVLEAEDLPPHDVMPSPQSAARIKEIADEAFRLHEDMLAERDAPLANDKMA